MVDAEILTPPPPTPSELLRVIVDIYGPTTSLFAQTIARETLATQMFCDAFHPKDPISKFVTLYLDYRRCVSNDPDAAQTRYDEIGAVFEEIQELLKQDLLVTA